MAPSVAINKQEMHSDAQERGRSGGVMVSSSEPRPTANRQPPTAKHRTRSQGAGGSSHVYTAFACLAALLPAVVCAVSVACY
jgi:hypothetical protein